MSKCVLNVDISLIGRLYKASGITKEKYAELLMRYRKTATKSLTRLEATDLKARLKKIIREGY